MQLKKELTLLEHGFYDSEVMTWIQNLIQKKRTGVACIHGSCACTDCCRKMWFRDKFLKKKVV